MIVVNLFGAPDAGQSAGAAYIFSMLKMSKVNVRLVNYKDSDGYGQIQTGLFGRKYSFLHMADVEGCDVVITDSPLFNCILYNGYSALSPEFDNLVRKAFASFQNMSYFVNREQPSAQGKRRIRVKDEWDELSKTIRQQLSVHHIPFCNITANQGGYDRVVEDVLARLRKQEELEQEDYED